MFSKAFYIALEECSAVKRIQLIEIPDAPTHGVQYPAIARRTLCSELITAAAGHIITGRGATAAARNAPERYKRGMALMREAGISQPTINIWVRKYTRKHGTPTRGI